MAGSRPSCRRRSTSGGWGWRAPPSRQAPGWSSPRAVTVRSGPARRPSPARRSRWRSCRWARPTWRRGRWASRQDRRIARHRVRRARAADRSGRRGGRRSVRPVPTGPSGGAGAVGGAGELTFAAMAGIGLDAEVVAATPRLLKRRAGWLAYAAAGIAHLARPGRALHGAPRRWRTAGQAGPVRGGRQRRAAARRVHPAAAGAAGRRPARRGNPGACGAAGWLRVAHQVLSRRRPRRPAAGTAPGTPGRDQNRYRIAARG